MLTHVSASLLAPSLGPWQCSMPGGNLTDSSAAAVLGGITNETLSGIESILPASKAQVRTGYENIQTEVAKLVAEGTHLQADNADLNAEVVDLRAGNAREHALLRNVSLQVDKLTLSRVRYSNACQTLSIENLLMV